MIQYIDRWFSPSTAQQDYQLSHYLLLILVLAIGTFLRFWGLANVGLHGDEETMAMPAISILKTGEPLLPSGMFYPRAMIQLYLMSGSVWLFGETEWALRLPSAIVGSLIGLAAFFLGRRFLPPTFNLAFVTSVVLLPSMIEISQTARMYVFFVACMIWFGACLFRWERDQRIMSLGFALVIWLLALHFHTLAIFAAPLFLFPGLSRQSWTQLLQGAAAFLAGGLIFNAYGNWIGSMYPDGDERPERIEIEQPPVAIDILSDGSFLLLTASLAIVATLSGILVFKSFRRTGMSGIFPAVLIGLGLIAIALLHYHLGGILLLLGAVLWLRIPQLPRRWLIGPVVLVLCMTIAHLVILHFSGQFPGRKLIGALVGAPSIWPVFRFLQYSPVAGVALVLGLLLAIWRFIDGHRIPVHFLFFAMAVWAPLLMIGFFKWNVPPRYAQGHIGFFLLCAFSAILYVMKSTHRTSGDGRLAPSMKVVLAVVSLAIINPFALLRSVNAGYERFPDHKGAAEYIESLNLPDSAILVAEDILQQTYYLGDVDYWLRQKDRAIRFSIIRDGQLYDQYTGAATLGTGMELIDVLDSNPDVDVFVIGSGENFVDGKRLLREYGIAEVLDSDRFEVVFVGRDRNTLVWRRSR